MTSEVHVRPGTRAVERRYGLHFVASSRLCFLSAEARTGGAKVKSEGRHRERFTEQLL